MNELFSFLKLSMLHVGYAKLDHRWGFKNVISPFVRLFLVTKGSAYAEYAGESFELRPGFMYLIPSFMYNDYRCNDYHEQYYTGFFEEIKLGMSVFNQKKTKYVVKANDTDYDLFKRLVSINPGKSIKDSNPIIHINRDLQGYKDSKKRSIQHIIETEAILTILFSRFIEDTAIITDKSSFKGDLNRVLIYIAKHLEEELTIAELARYCNLSADHFSKSFFLKFNMKPNKYIQLKRIERAQFLLLTTNDSLLQIAENVGLKSLSYFSKKFKEKVGVSPAKFRKEQLKL